MSPKLLIALDKMGKRELIKLITDKQNLVRVYFQICKLVQ